MSRAKEEGQWKKIIKARLTFLYIARIEMLMLKRKKKEKKIPFESAF